MQPDELEEARRLYQEVAVLNPTALTKVQPDYPEGLARQAGLEGQVTLQATVGTDGMVLAIEVLHSSRPNFGFEESAIEAVLQWRYDEPARRGNTPVAVYITVVVDFTR
jgi:TonB family protein